MAVGGPEITSAPAARRVFHGLRRGGYSAIVIDPPWRFAGNSVAKPGRNAMRHYGCMKVDEIAALPVGELAAPDCRLFLWITSPMLAAGVHIRILESWGFTASTIGFTWVKLNADGSLFVNKGYHTRQNPEFVIIGKRGSPARASKKVRAVIKTIADQVIEAPRREHSRKPDEFYDRVEQLVGDVPKADLFARQRRRGWRGWGDELETFGKAA